MSPGERAVWAATYAAELNLGKSAADSARRAASVVKQLRTLHIHAQRAGLDADEQDMLDAILASGR